jgi:glycosyltransferase involved in cell wall biosynthesis
MVVGGTMSVTVVIGTYGDQSWVKKAETAVESVRSQSRQPDLLITRHAATLAGARNSGASMSTSRWLIFLDADDTLHPEYVRSMMERVEDAKTALLVQPSTQGFYPDGSWDETADLIPPHASLLQGNHMVIGTMCDRELFNQVGGFDDKLPVLEDWDLWIRLHRAGSKITTCPEAIYQVGVNPASRNQPQNLHTEVYGAIRRKYR